MKTQEEAEEVMQRIRQAVARNRALSWVAVAQVTDNQVDSRDPYGWKVQLLDGRTHNLPAYVRSWEHWRTEVKPALLGGVAEGEQSE